MPFNFSGGAGSLDDFYGFKTSNDRTKQLQQVLGMKCKPAEFKIVMDELEELTVKHVDIDGPLCANNQPKALVLIEEELLKLRPTLWGDGHSEKKIYFALRAVMAIHSRRKKERSGILYSMSKKRKRPAMAASHSNDLSDSGDEEYRPDNVPHKNRNEHHNSRHTPYNPNKLRHETESGGLSEGPSKMRSTKRDDSSSLLEVESSDLTPPPKKPKRVAPSVDEQNRIVKTQEQPLDLNYPEISFLRNFLSACKPSMVNHLGLFLNFGRQSSWKAALRSIHENWAPEDRKNLLRQILAGDEKMLPVSELDVAILDNHLKTYFS